MRRWLAVLLLCVPVHAGAEVLHYNLCTLKPGKTLEDVRGWLTDWKALVAKNELAYRMRILLPHADPQTKLDQFFLEGSSSTLVTYAKAWDWWYANADAQALNAKLEGTASCDGGSVYVSAD